MEYGRERLDSDDHRHGRCRGAFVTGVFPPNNAVDVSPARASCCSSASRSTRRPPPPASRSRRRDQGAVPRLRATGRTVELRPGGGAGARPELPRAGHDRAARSCRQPGDPVRLDLRHRRRRRGAATSTPTRSARRAGGATLDGRQRRRQLGLRRRGTRRRQRHDREPRDRRPDRRRPERRTRERSTRARRR